MAIKKYNPTSPARRFMTVSDFSEITKFEPERSLLASKNSIPFWNACFATIIWTSRR